MRRKSATTLVCRQHSSRTGSSPFSPSPLSSLKAHKTKFSASWFRGIHLTINIPLNKTMTSRDIRQIYQDRYAGEKLVKVVGEAPLVRAIQDKHGVEIGGFAVDSTGKRVVV